MDATILHACTTVPVVSFHFFHLQSVKLNICMKCLICKTRGLSVTLEFVTCWILKALLRKKDG